MDTRELIKKWILWKSGSEKKSYSYKALALDAEINPNYLSNVMTGIRNPGAKTLLKIAGALGVSMSEFYIGPPETAPHSLERTVSQSPVSKTVETEKDFPQSISIEKEEDVEKIECEKVGLKLSGDASDEFDKLFSTMGYKTSDGFVPQPETSSTEQINHEVKTVDSVPAVTEISDTIPIMDKKPPCDWREWVSDYKENKTKYTSIPRFFGVKGKNAFAVIVEDNSMAPDLNEGDILIINPEMSFTNTDGGIGVVFHQNCLKIRQVKAQDEDYVLIPSNSGYDTEIVPKQDARLFKVALWIPQMEDKF